MCTHRADAASAATGVHVSSFLHHPRLALRRLASKGVCVCVIRACVCDMCVCDVVYIPCTRACRLDL